MNGKSIPARKVDLAALVATLATSAGRSPSSEVVRFEALRKVALEEKRTQNPSQDPGVKSHTWLGSWVEDFRDPFLLEVHRPIQMEGAPSGVPQYIKRGHDSDLRETLAHDGPGLIVLVGGSSTGKTRAAYEAARNLSGWRLYHPIYPSKPDALVAALQSDSLYPNTIVWMNELQDYLLPDGGERAAAALRNLLTGSSKVKAIGTMWPQYWQQLTELAGPFPQSRELLNNLAVRLEMDPAFPDASLASAARADARLRLALSSSPDRITQYIAAGPALLEFFKDCKDSRPATWAILCAAMDAYTVGRPESVSESFMKRCAPGYLTDEEWGSLEDDWIPQALQCATTMLRGAARPLSRLRSRSAEGGEPRFRLADYLVQHAHQERSQRPVPRSFWRSVSEFQGHADLATFARAADERGMRQEAAELWEPLASVGDPEALRALLSNPCANPAKARGLVTRFIEETPLSEIRDIGWMLVSLHEHPVQKMQLVKRIGGDISNLTVGPPLEMSTILRELELSGATQSVKVYADSIGRSLHEVEISDFWDAASLIEVLVDSAVEEVHEVGFALAGLYFQQRDMDAGQLASCLALICHRDPDPALADSVRSKLRKKLHEVDVADLISVHPTVANLFFSGEDKMARTLLDRVCASIDSATLGSSYAPLELLQMLSFRGYEEGCRRLSRRIAQEYDPVLSHSSVVALDYLRRNHCTQDYHSMARRLAETGPILPLAGAEELANLYLTRGFSELHRIYSQRVLDFRRQEGT